MSNDKFQKAVELDIAESVEVAAFLYEEVIKETQPPLETFLNLSCLYWQTLDYGFNAALQLNLDFIAKADTRHKQVLDEAVQLYGNLPEIKFWRKYFDWTILGEDLAVEWCIEIVAEANASDVPYFFIFDQTRNKKYLLKVHRLLDEAKELSTTKNRYISSYIESSLQTWSLNI